MSQETYIYEAGDIVTFSEDVLTFDQQQEVTIFEVEEINGNQFLRIGFICEFKVPAFFVEPYSPPKSAMQKRE
jgi:hypothetical protein